MIVTAGRRTSGAFHQSTQQRTAALELRSAVQAASAPC